MTHVDDNKPDDASGSAAEDTAYTAERALETVMHDAVTELSGVLSGFWSTVEEQVRLAALAGYDYGAAQEDRVAIIALGHRALEFATRYRSAIEAEFEKWRGLRAAEAVDDASDDDFELELTLMSEGELEINLAGQQIIELLDHQFLHPLAQLGERFAALARSLGLSTCQRNPLRPEVAVNAFVDLFDPDDLTPGLRLMVFRQFDTRLPKILAEVYARANETLQLSGFRGSYAATTGRRGQGAASMSGVIGRLPGNAGDVPQDSGSAAAARAPPGSGWIPYGQSWLPVGDTGGSLAPGRSPEPFPGLSAVDPGAGQAPPPEFYRETMREQLHRWRLQQYAVPLDLGAGPPAAGPVERAAMEPSVHPQVAAKPVPLARRHLYDILLLLQREDDASWSDVLAGRDPRSLSTVIRSKILGSIGRAGLDPMFTHLDQGQDDVIDLVGMLFESLFQANGLPDGACPLYGRLIPIYLRVAFEDDTALFGGKLEHPARSLLDMLAEACDDVRAEGDGQTAALQLATDVVERLREDFCGGREALERAVEAMNRPGAFRQETGAAERLAVEIIHGRERLLAARASADGHVVACLSERPVTSVVAGFLAGHWRRHLVRTWLRPGPDSSVFEQAVMLGAELVDLDALASRPNPDLVDQLLRLWPRIIECCTGCGLDEQGTADVCAGLAAAFAFSDTPRIRYPADHLEMSGFPGHPAREASPAGTGKGTGSDADPALLEVVRRLAVGQGLKLVDADGRESAAVIAWISPLTCRLLIVNRRGERRLVVSPEGLAMLLQSGKAVLGGVETPFDEAIKHLWQRLSAARASIVPSP